MAFEALGFDVGSGAGRHKAAIEVAELLRADVALSPHPPPRPSAWGMRYDTKTLITGPNGRKGMLNAVWQQDPGVSEPRLITNWLQVHKDGRSP